VPSAMEVLKEHFARKWTCRDHLKKGEQSGVNPLLGAEAGCNSCVTWVAALVCEVMDVQMPKKREPGPRVPMVNEGRMVDALKDKCNEIGHLIGEGLPPGVGFCLLVFEFTGPQLHYICNAQREDMIELLEEFKQSLSKGK